MGGNSSVYSLQTVSTIDHPTQQRIYPGVPNSNNKKLSISILKVSVFTEQIYILVVFCNKYNILFLIILPKHNGWLYTASLVWQTGSWSNIVATFLISVPNTTLLSLIFLNSLVWHIMIKNLPWDLKKTFN